MALSFLGGSHNRRQKSQGFGQKQHQTLFLEPRLTPSGLVDTEGQTPDVADLSLSVFGDEADNLDLDVESSDGATMETGLDEAVENEAGFDEAVESTDEIEGNETPLVTVVEEAFLPEDEWEEIDPDVYLADLDGLIQFEFESGVFTVGETGEVSVDFLFHGGSYQGELALFSLEGMEEFELGSEAFIKEAARRALSDSDLGHVAISARNEGARFSGRLPGEARDWNSGDYLGVKTFQMKPGDEFGVMLVPNGRVIEVLNKPSIGGSKMPLFSMATANPDDMFAVGQIVDVFGDGNAFVFEDMRIDKGSDRDYNDLIFQVRGAKGYAALMDEVVNPAKDWRLSNLGQVIQEYVKPYITPEPEVPEPIMPVAPVLEEGDIIPEPRFAIDDLENAEALAPTIPNLDAPPEDQPLTEGIDTGFSGDNPDLVPEPIFDPIDDLDIVEVLAPTMPSWEVPPENQPLVGVIDTGFSGNNPDLDYSKITSGYDWVAGDENSFLASGEGNEHGTHVLGIIAAQQGNGIGIEGLNDDAPIWVGRAIGSGEWADSLVEFVEHYRETNQPNAVVNLSLDLTQVNPDGSVTTRYELTPAERAAIDYARQHEIILVVAAGNDGGVMSAIGQAAQEFDNIITVGAAERVTVDLANAEAYTRADYSSYGQGLDILAPGGTADNPVLSTVGDTVGGMAGSSVAAAKVTGSISKIWAANPDLNYQQIIDLVKSTATDLDRPNWDGATGAGLINLTAAISMARATTPEPLTDIPATLIPETWSGEGIATPIERAAATPFMGKYYEWDRYTVRSGDTLSGIAQRTMGSSGSAYWNFIRRF